MRARPVGRHWRLQTSPWSPVDHPLFSRRGKRFPLFLRLMNRSKKGRLSVICLLYDLWFVFWRWYGIRSKRLLKRLALFSGVKGRRTDRRREGLRLYVSSMPWVCVLEVIGITNRRLLNRLAFFFRGPSQNSRADVSQSIQCLQSILAAKSISYKASTAQRRQSEQSKNDQMFCWSSRAGHANQVHLKKHSAKVSNISDVWRISA